MGYFKDLEEYTDLELANELTRRNEARKQGLCSYCKRPFESTTPCRLHENPFITSFIRFDTEILTRRN